MRTVLALGLMLMLCGCVVEPVYGDPYSVIAQAEGAIESTQAARAGRVVEATLEAGRTMQALVVEGTQQAWLAESTQSAAQATGTQEALQAGTMAAWDATATAWPGTATMAAGRATLEGQAVQATGTAMALEMNRSAEDAQRREAFSWVWMMAAALLVLGLSGISVWAMWTMMSYWVVWEDRKRSLVQANGQVIVYKVQADGQYAPEVLDGRRLLVSGRRVSGMDEVRAVTVSGSVLESPIVRKTDPDGSVSMAKRLLMDAVTQGWGEGDRLPGWRKLNGWSSPRWQRGLGPLKAAGVVEVGVDGTYVFGYACVVDLWQAVIGGQVQLHPTPPEGDGMAGTVTRGHAGARGQTSV